MIQLSQSRIQLTKEQPLSANAATIEEGMGLQWVMENGQNYVTPGTGASGVFAGIAWGYFMRPSSAVKVETFTVPTTAPYTVTLNQSPNAVSSVSVVSGGAQFTYEATTLGAAGEFMVGGTNNQTVTFDAANAGAVVTVTYRYNLTVLQAEQFTGDGYTLNPPANVTGTIGVIQKGTVFVSNFDTSVFWGSGTVTSITLGANGIFTVGGTGASVNANVFSAPTADVPYLGLELTIA